MYENNVRHLHPRHKHNYNDKHTCRRTHTHTLTNHSMTRNYSGVYARHKYADPRH